MGNMMRGASDSSKVNTDNPDSAQKGKVTNENFKTQKCICKVTLFEKKRSEIFICCYQLYSFCN